MVTFRQKWDEYSNLVSEKLNNAAPEAFTPTLAVMDELVGSITVSQ
jgi:hypothetical protein